MSLSQFDFNKQSSFGMLIAAGGFEKRALSFVRRVDVRRFRVHHAILLRYITQRQDNEANFNRLIHRVKQFSHTLEVLDVDIDTPDRVQWELEQRILSAQASMASLSVVVDVSGMAHVLVCCSLRALDLHSLPVTVVYTEASDYYPREPTWSKVTSAVQKRDFQVTAKYLQTAGLKDIHVPTQFKGNTRPGYQTCLFILAGYEPNRVQGLIDDYAPGAVVVFYGKSPHARLAGRQTLSKELHKYVFEGWRHREIHDVSTLQVHEVLTKLESEYKTLRTEYDVAIASQCSKMQTVATYLFWRRHREVQLVFTTAVRIEPKRYSRGEGITFRFDIT